MGSDNTGVARWFLGIDGGATKTHCVLYDMQTDKLDTEIGGPTNHEVLPEGMQSLPDAISALVRPLLTRAGITMRELSAASFGMGGVDTPMQHELISGILGEMGFRRFVLSNDAYLGVKAECSGYGVSAVNGSGYSVVGISPTGEMLQIGGHNDMTGDMGGGSHLVPAALRAAYAQLYKRGPETEITRRLYEWIGIENRESFCEAVALQIMQDEAAAYHTISRILYKSAANGDAAANAILEACGEDYALSVQCVAEDLALPFPVDVILVGSQFTKCESARAIDVMRAALEKAGDYRVRPISTAPVAGALFWAMELAGQAPAQEKRKQLRERLSVLERSE